MPDESSDTVPAPSSSAPSQWALAVRVVAMGPPAEAARAWDRWLMSLPHLAPLRAPHVIGSRVALQCGRRAARAVLRGRWRCGWWPWVLLRKLRVHGTDG